MEVQFWYDKKTLLVGEAVAEDNSTSDERGLKSDRRLHIKDFSIIVYIRSIDYDVTTAFTEAQRLSFEESLRDYVMEKHWADIVSEVA